jgi:selenocysteine lyase/cysteine desulfurase
LLQSVGLQNIYNEASRLADLLREGLVQQGYILQCEGGPIVNFTGSDLLDVEKKLTAAKIGFAKRAGGIRLSTHAYNRDEEVEYFFRVLK